MQRFDRAFTPARVDRGYAAWVQGDLASGFDPVTSAPKRGNAPSDGGAVRFAQSRAAQYQLTPTPTVPDVT